MKNPLLSLKEKEHQHAFYTVAIIVMITILFFLLASLESPRKKNTNQTQEEVIEIEFEHTSAYNHMSNLEEQRTLPIHETIPVNEIIPISDYATELVTSNKIDHSLGFNSSGVSSSTLTFGNHNGDDILSFQAIENGNSERAIIKHPNLDHQAQEEGTIALQIWAGSDGKVIKTRLNPLQSNRGSQYLIDLAKKAALTMRFAPNENVPAELIGTKIFSFKKM